MRWCCATAVWRMRRWNRRPALIQFPVEPGRSYEVQATTDFQSWETLWQTGVADANVWLQFTDPDTGAYTSRFYRLAMY